MEATLPASRYISEFEETTLAGPRAACFCRKPPHILQSARPTSSVFPIAGGLILILHGASPRALPQALDAKRPRSKAEIFHKCGRGGKRNILEGAEKRSQGLHSFSTVPIVHAIRGLRLLRCGFQALDFQIGTRKIVNTKRIGRQDEPVGFNEDGIWSDARARRRVGSIFGAHDAIRIQEQ